MRVAVGFDHAGVPLTDTVLQAVRDAGHEPVDVFLAGIAGRQVTPHYWRRILPKLDPRVLVPTHYDDFFAPLGRRLRLVRGVALATVPDEVRTVTPDATVAALSRSDSG